MFPNKYIYDGVIIQGTYWHKIICDDLMRVTKPFCKNVRNTHYYLKLKEEQALNKKNEKKTLRLSFLFKSNEEL